MQNGQLKPGYNVQIATEGQYTLAYDVYPNPTDARTFIPFLDEVASYLTLPEHIVADAGYGSQENYQEILMRRGRIPLVPYTVFQKEKTRKWRDHPFNLANWSYNETTDHFVCPNGQNVTFRYMSKRTDRYGFTRDFKVYVSESCDDCPLRSLCTKAEKGRHRQVRVNVSWEDQKEQVKNLLSDQKTGKIYAKRKIDVEPVFGNLKANLRFTRFSVRGKAKVKRELGFILMAVNLRKWLTQSIARGAI